MEYKQTLGAEVANSITHGIGALLGTAGLVLLIMRAKGFFSAGISAGGNGVIVTVFVIFASAMILMFLASTLYHAMQNQIIKKVFRIFDHQAIYLLIAGTYTPFCLLALKGVWGWSLLGFEWALAIAGIVLYALNFGFLKKAELIIFMLMGWAIVTSCVPLVRSISLRSLVLLMGGGAFYTLGTLWYRAGKKKNSGCAHVIWHVFVLAGAACHWWSVWYLVI
jgi:hemolysin III